MKYIIMSILFAFSSNAFSMDFNCEFIKDSMVAAKRNGCNQASLCMGYAECVNPKNPKKKSIGRIVCFSNSDGICPSANECMDAFYNKHEFAISYIKDPKEGSIYRLCNSNELGTPTSNADVANSRFCNNVTGDYFDKVGDDLLGQQTNVTGGGGQMGSSKK